MQRIRVQQLAGRGSGIVAAVPLAAGEEVLAEYGPLCRAALAQILLDLQEETAMLVSMGYLTDFWAHAVNDRRVVDCCRASLAAATAQQQAAFHQLEDAFATSGPEGRFFTNNIQLPLSDGVALGDLAVYELYSRLNHSCEANVRVRLSADGHLAVIALKDLAAGEELVDNYLTAMPVEGTGARLEMRRHLKDRWRFDCTCARCEREGLVTTDDPAAHRWEDGSHYYYAGACS